MASQDSGKRAFEEDTPVLHSTSQFRDAFGRSPERSKNCRPLLQSDLATQAVLVSSRMIVAGSGFRLIFLQQLPTLVRLNLCRHKPRLWETTTVTAPHLHSEFRASSAKLIRQHM